MFTSGHRNVQGIAWEPGTDRAFVTELGPDKQDKVNVLKQGADYGWPDGGGGEKPIVEYGDVISPSGATPSSPTARGRATSCSRPSAASSSGGCRSTATR